MASRPDYYAILGVSPSSDDVVIRAAFKAMMLKYHPDTNKSVDATHRAAAINEAFATLGDPQRRAAYDASRTRGSYTSPPAPPPPPPSGAAGASPLSEPSTTLTHQGILNPGWAGRLAGIAAVVLLSVGVRVAVQRSNGNPTSSSAFSAAAATDLSAGMDTMTDRLVTLDQAVGQPSSVPETLMANMADAVGSADSSLGPPDASLVPTAVSFRDIEAGASTFEKVLNARGIIGARAWSQKCHEGVDRSPDWNAADRCAAFDFAARYMDAGMVSATGVRPNAYFAFQAANQAENYKVVGGQPWSVDDRLRRIQSAVEPMTYEAILAGIQQRETGRASSQPQGDSSSEPAMTSSTEN